MQCVTLITKHITAHVTKTMEHWHDKKILVLGSGDTGVSVARYLRGLGACVRVADSRDDPPNASVLAELGCPLLSGAFANHADRLFGDAELIVASPGVAVAGPACDPAIARAVQAGKKFVGDIELFAWAQNALTTEHGKKPKVIGITGSNGKSTVTAMAGAMCAAAGLRTVVAGNIGLPVLDALRDAAVNGAPDVYVLELSSFQLETTDTLQLDAATMLNLSQDHLDRYSSMQDYAAAKQRIFAHSSRQVVNRDDPVSMSMKDPGCDCVSFGLNAPNKEKNFGLLGGNIARGTHPLVPLSALQVPGLHNAANAMAALALVEAIDVDLEDAVACLKTFTGLPHRSQRVLTINGVMFLNDSKGTNVGSTVAALAGMTAPTVLIAGGEGKEQDFSPLSEPVRRHAKAVVLIGRAARAIESAIASSRVAVIHAVSMEDAVHKSFSLAVEGDVVLLSPACASFDMFQNYKHRGDVFSSSVHTLAQKLAGGGHV
jgi:UDP-N-acetylmuramoylalanine--D-glutamate ligase